MNGHEHYSEAERLLDVAHLNSTNPQITYDEDKGTIAAAQVHATLALAAATIGQLYMSRSMKMPAVAERWFR